MPDLTAPLARLRPLVASDTPPVLSHDELVLCLADAAVMDADGNLPAGTLWAGAWDINAAAAAAWEMKAAQLADVMDYSVDGASFSRSQQFEQAMRMRAHYGQRVGRQVIDATGATIRTGSANRDAVTIYTAGLIRNPAAADIESDWEALRNGLIDFGG